VEDYSGSGPRTSNPLVLLARKDTCSIDGDRLKNKEENQVGISQSLEELTLPELSGRNCAEKLSPNFWRNVSSPYDKKREEISIRQKTLEKGASGAAASATFPPPMRTSKGMISKTPPNPSRYSNHGLQKKKKGRRQTRGQGKRRGTQLLCSIIRGAS